MTTVVLPRSELAGRQSDRPSPDHLPTLDGLRGVAVLLVMLTHLALADAAPRLEWFKNTVRAGYTGVDIFFVLSGFLVTRILIHDWHTGQPLGRFLWRRALRIFPAYYLLLFILAFVVPGSYVVACMCYLSNVTDAIAENARHPMRHAWSLAIEEQFYLFWPALFYLAGAPRARMLAFVALPAVALTSLAIIAWLSRDGLDLGSWTYRLPVTRLLSLSFGCSLAFLEPWLRARPRRLVAVGALCLAVGASVAGVGLGVLRIPSGVPGTVAFALVSTACVLVAIAMHTGAAPLRAILANPPLRATGKISYGLYLYHFPIYIAFGVRYAEDHPSGLRALAAVVTAFAAAIASWFLVERPILRNRDRIPTPWALVRRGCGMTAARRGPGG